MRYEKKKLEEIVLESNNYSEVVSKLGLNPKSYGNRQTVKKYIDLFEINIKHFWFKSKNNLSNFNKLKIEDILISNSTYNTTHLKERLYKEGLKEYKCELCGQTEIWKGKHMSLILDHINGVNNDNRIENLRIVCPNCNATLETHCRGNKVKKTIIIKEPGLTEKQIIIKEPGLTEKQIIGHFKQRKVERPSYEQLKIDINCLGYTKTGKKYNVSDNSIRKWLKMYEK